MAKHPSVKGAKIGILGHSEGGLIAPIVANETSLLKFNVLLAGPGVDGRKIIESQSKAIAMGRGVPEGLAEMAVKRQSVFFEAIQANADKEDIKDELKTVLEKLVGEMPEGVRKVAMAQGEQEIEQLSSPWIRFFINYDPAPALSSNKIPTLALLGGKDLQVLVDANQEALQKALDTNGVEGNELVVIENANHLFQTSEVGIPSEYQKIDETIRTDVLDRIIAWIRKR